MTLFFDVFAGFDALHVEASRQAAHIIFGEPNFPVARWSAVAAGRDLKHSDGRFPALASGQRPDRRPFGVGLMSPHDILTDYSNGRISSSRAAALLHLDGYRELLIAMCDAGHPLPRPSEEEIDAQVAAALPLLMAALIKSAGDQI